MEYKWLDFCPDRGKTSCKNNMSLPLELLIKIKKSLNISLQCNAKRSIW